MGSLSRQRSTPGTGWVHRGGLVYGLGMERGNRCRMRTSASGTTFQKCGGYHSSSLSTAKDKKVLEISRDRLKSTTSSPKKLGLVACYLGSDAWALNFQGHSPWGISSFGKVARNGLYLPLYCILSPGKQKVYMYRANTWSWCRINIWSENLSTFHPYSFTNPWEKPTHGLLVNFVISKLAGRFFQQVYIIKYVKIIHSQSKSEVTLKHRLTTTESTRMWPLASKELRRCWQRHRDYLHPHRKTYMAEKLCSSTQGNKTV